MIRKRSMALAIGLAATLALPAVVPVLASYPGATNGRIAFGQRAADGSSNIFSVMPDGTGLKQLTHGAHNHLCAAYSADGQQIAYCSDVSGSWEIWSMKQNGTKQHQVTHLNGFSTFPDYSPDGSKIAFVSQLATDSSDQVFVVNAANGGGLTQLTSCPVVAGRQEDRLHPRRAVRCGRESARRAGLGHERRRFQQAAAHDGCALQGPGP